MLSKIDKMKFLINDFQALRSSKRTIRLNRIAAFLSTFEENHRKLRNQRLADFNVFSLLRIGEDEVRQSKFLAWLLDAESGHGQGNLFLQAFVKSCHLNIPLEVLDQYRVRTEYYRNESRIDVLAYRKGEFLIYLENKIAVFLTPDAKKQPTSGDATRWLSVSYNQIGAEFKKLLPGITSDKVKFILKDWMDTISLWRYL
jgi:hypothetical protein